MLTFNCGRRNVGAVDGRGGLNVRWDGDVDVAGDVDVDIGVGVDVDDMVGLAVRSTAANNAMTCD